MFTAPYLTGIILVVVVDFLYCLVCLREILLHKKIKTWKKFRVVTAPVLKFRVVSRPPCPALPRACPPPPPPRPASRMKKYGPTIMGVPSPVARMTICIIIRLCIYFNRIGQTNKNNLNVPDSIGFKRVYFFE